MRTLIIILFVGLVGCKKDFLERKYSGLVNIEPEMEIDNHDWMDCSPFISDTTYLYEEIIVGYFKSCTICENKINTSCGKGCWIMGQ